uniref:PPUP7988 n=1 Tax=Poeciliopsis prolifica TaxID=188132 RepID=A0A0S7ETP7_9TELE
MERNFKGCVRRRRPTLGCVCEVQSAAGESDVAEERDASAATAGLCKALPQPRSQQRLYGSSKHLRDSLCLLEEGLAIHSVVLLSQDTHHMTGCYGQPQPTHSMLECLSCQQGWEKG